jgi:quinol monooxygenase YgiN
MHAQIVTFRLKPGCSRETFLALTEQMATWLKDQAGFVAYELYEGVECWTDRIVWASEASAREGLDRFRATAMAPKLMQCVENDFSSFFGNAVVTRGLE